MTLLRYPGGKKKLKKVLLPVLRIYAKMDYEYREPFFGGGSFLTNLKFKRIWINDADYALSCLWTSVAKNPEELKRRVMDFTPSVSSFYDYKRRLLEKDYGQDVTETGFIKLAIHQISYSGLGPKSGGPLGGKEQRSKYKIDCRWNPDYICKKIDSIHSYFNSIELLRGECTSEDFLYLIKEPAGDKKVVLYLDPPYYEKGEELYQHSFGEEDHQRLMESLKLTGHKWFLSYDDCPEIRDMYKWAKIFPVQVNYTINGSFTKPEVVITS